MGFLLRFVFRASRGVLLSIAYLTGFFRASFALFTCAFGFIPYT
jgi:hypothetical protein